MRHRLSWTPLVATLIWAGCQTPSPKNPRSTRVPDPTPVPTASVPAEESSASTPVIVPVSPPGTPVVPSQSLPPRIQDSETRSAPNEDNSVRVESSPSGATVVVDGVPVGRTPMLVPLDVGGNGFLRKAVSIRVRFIAADSTETTQSVEANLTPLDKVPACLKFGPEGVQRVLR